jgi:tRNA uridine 5-carboxymethylaminomethyl modification enzyme
VGEQLGVVGAQRAALHRLRQAQRDSIRLRLESLALTPDEAADFGLALNRDGKRRSAFELLSHPEIDWARLACIWPELAATPPALVDRISADATYAVYLDRQERDIEAYRRDAQRLIDVSIDIDSVPGLSNELRQKLKAAQPLTLAQAATLEGITPAALTLLAARSRRKPSGGAPDGR